VPASFPRVRSAETGVGTARPRAPRPVRERSDTEAARAEGASLVSAGARARVDGEAGIRKRDGDRFKPRVNPRGQMTARSLRACAHLFISPIQPCGLSSCQRLRCRGDRNQTLQPLDFFDEVERLRRDVRFKLRRGVDVAIPRSAIPGCAIVNADVLSRAMGGGFLIGRNEFGLAFGEALAPDSDGFAKPTAVE
jgi:hypothetical protein